MNRLERLVPDLAQTLIRFPIPVLAAVVLCVYLMSVGGDPFNSGYIGFLAGSAAFLAAGAAHLFAESRVWPRLIGLSCSTMLGGFAAAVMYFNKSFQSSELYFFAALQLILMLSPFLHRGAHQGAVWLFNLRLLLAALLALIVGLVFAGGMSAVLVGLDFLLGFKIDSQVYDKVWIIAVTMVGPIYGLSLVPKDLNEEINMATHEGNLLERGVSVLVNYVMVPLAAVYALILHAYAAKIGFLGALPKGEIGWIVSLFAVGGTATWLIGWPWRETGTKLLRLFMRAWFWLLPIPVALLVLAIWRRVADYGVTPDRYGIAIVAVWAVLVFIYLVWRRNQADMRAILGAAAVLLLIGSFGPQGAYGLTGASQAARLQALLERVGVFKDGKVVAVLPKIQSNEASAGYSMLSAIAGARATDRIKPWFNDKSAFKSDGDQNRWTLINDVSKVLGLDGVGLPPDLVNLEAQLPIDKSWTRKARFIGPVFVYAQGNSNQTSKSNFGALVKDGNLKISLDGQDFFIGLNKLLDEIKAGVNSDPTQQAMVLVDIDPHLSLIVKSAFGKVGTVASLNSMQFWIVQHE